ncbi:MAG: DUF5519 family protein [Anaerolineae bacterium]|nr:DUF5519 family protein [Anaerolineae bacterium]
MRELVQRVIAAVSAFPDVSAAPHRFGGVEFSLGKVEVGHIHVGNGMVDIPYPRRIRDVLIAEGLAQQHHLLHDSGWITTFVRTDADFERIVSLYHLSYVQKRFRRRADRESDTYQAAVEALPFSDAVKATLQPAQSTDEDVE